MTTDTTKTTPLREQVLELVREERARQIQQYGGNDFLPLGFGSSLPWLAPFGRYTGTAICEAFRRDYAFREQTDGGISWMLLIREEISELFETGTPEAAINEAVQAAALLVSLMEHLLVENREAGL